MRRPYYPEWLEEEWLAIVGEPDAMHLEKDIAQLSDLYTCNRSALSKQNYYQEKGLIAAYGLFFFPQAFVRTHITIREMLARGWTPSVERPLRILDLASGLGAASFGALWAFAQKEIETSARIHAVDRAAEALEISSRLADRLQSRFPPFQWRSDCADVTDLRRLKQTAGDCDLILISFGLNELFQNAAVSDVSQWLRAAMELLAPQGILLILEPALQQTSERLETLRDDIVSQGRYFIWGPCLHRAFCPLLKQRKYWCHEVRSWNPPETLRWLNRHLHRKVAVLKFSFLALSPSQPPVLPGVFASHRENALRLISPVSARKGRVLFSGCAADGVVRQYDLLSRNTSNKHNRRWERGDILLLEQTQHLSGGNLRIRTPEDVRKVDI